MQNIIEQSTMCMCGDILHFIDWRGVTKDCRFNAQKVHTIPAYHLFVAFHIYWQYSVCSKSYSRGRIQNLKHQNLLHEVTHMRKYFMRSVPCHETTKFQFAHIGEILICEILNATPIRLFSNIKYTQPELQFGCIAIRKWK